jgi:hypothetical protein
MTRMFLLGLLRVGFTHSSLMGQIGAMAKGKATRSIALGAMLESIKGPTGGQRERR